MSDDDCQIGNHCKEIIGGKEKSTRCVPRDDLDDTYYCSLTQKSCASKKIFLKLFLCFLNHINVAIPCCSGQCDNISKLCIPLLPPNCSLPSQFMATKSSTFLIFHEEKSAAFVTQGKTRPSMIPTAAPKRKTKKPTSNPTKGKRHSRKPTSKPSKIPQTKRNAVPSSATTAVKLTSARPTVPSIAPTVRKILIHNS